MDSALGQSGSVLSLMITPVILILAAASLVGATTARLENVGGSMRQLAESFEHHVAREHDHSTLRDEQLMLWVQIERSSRRVRLMQLTVALLHVAIVAFVLTSVGLGFDAATDIDLGILPVILGLNGGLLLLASAIVLVYDALIAVNATREEAEFTLRMTEVRASQSRHGLDKPRTRFVVPRP